MKERRTTVPGNIFFSGIDGSGKTVLADTLVGELEKRGLPVRYVWMRYNHYLTKPLLAFCRAVGLTTYETVEGQKIGVHHFYKSRLVSFLFVALTFLDTGAASLLRLRLSKWMHRRVVVCDRFVLDILVDLMIDIGKPRMFEGFWGAAFRKLLPRDGKCFYIRRPFDAVLDARPELKGDAFVQQRIELYQALVYRWGVQVIDNSGTLVRAHDEILSGLGLERWTR